MTAVTRANAVALLLPAALMAGALGSQYVGGLYPCEMCHWQRWPHYAAIGIALVAFMLKPPVRNVAVALAALAILTSGILGVFHAGVEYHWWAGPPCSASGPGMTLEEIMRQPLVRCDAPQWTLGPISLAGFNAIFSLLGALAIMHMIRKAR